MQEFSGIFTDLLNRFKAVEKKFQNFETWEPAEEPAKVGDDVIVNEATNASTNSTTYVDIDTNLVLTITPTSGTVLLGCTLYCEITAGSGFFDFEIDGTNFVGDDGLAAVHFASSARANIAMTARISGLSEAAHTFKVQYKLSNVANTLTVYRGAGTANRDTHPHFWVQEV